MMNDIYVSRETLLAAVKPLNINLDEKMLSDFEAFAERLVETNKSLNLTAITDPEGIAVKHFADSLAVLAAAKIPKESKILDVGTGAGFPAMPLMIARRDLKMTVLDSTAKKLKFVEESANSLGLFPEVIHSRAEELGKKSGYRESFDFVTARAVANLRELSEYCLPFVKIGGLFLAMKGPLAGEELEGAKKAVKLLGGKIEQVFSSDLADENERSIILIRKISQTPPKYPRASAQIAKKPII